jgi:protein-S-isoprenylcysteine O-methyltransferase Ste14
MPTKLAALAAYLIGIAGPGVFFGYVVGAGTGFWPRGTPEDGMLPWGINFGWQLLFAVQHSGMARQSFKQWLTRWIPASLQRSLYIAISSILLAALTLGWQPLPGEPIWHGPLWIAVISLLAGLGTGLCCGWFDHTAFFGLRQAWTGNASASSPLRIVGPYRFVRHPLMLGLLIVIWAQPIMPPELMMMNIGWTVYILIAIRLEERDLVREYGAAYEEYRRKVPALIPYRVLV